jgi:intracellular sulfur oxidation DsrE/DsrF family protein
MKVLQIIDTAYRATLEEQDDTVLWLTQALHAAGADLAVLLSGSAVNYAAASQNASGLQIGNWHQRHPPKIAGDIAALLGKGVRVYGVQEDFDALGLREATLVAGVHKVPRARLGALFEEFDRVWQW